MANYERTPLNADRTRPAVALSIGLAMLVPTLAQDAGEWVLPRTEYGHPDLQGNWTNATLTGVQRPEGFDKVLTAEQIAAMEGRRQETIATDAAPSDPDR
ncbi:MAG: hypothetical protein O6931_07315, partial [Gammaproteobacteria bacterium]|nr:hypothetical protein [Gammaproteobacteria bacterium]